MKLANLIMAIAMLSISIFSFAQENITIFAAASMSNVLQKIADDYQTKHQNHRILFSFAASSVLARQITQGAPADLFISADETWMNYLVKQDHIEPTTLTSFAMNELVMIAPKNNPIKHIDLTTTHWQSYLEQHFLAVGDPNHVPAGIYAKEAFHYLNQWGTVKNKLARTNNVRIALALVERAEAPLGVVYATDAYASNKVNIVATFPKESHSPIVYPMAIIKHHQTQATQLFYQYLLSPSAQSRLAEFGFITQKAIP